LVIEAPVNTPDAWSERADTIAEPWTACGWSYESQDARFEAVVAGLNPQPGEWLLDWGCGLGDLCGYLDPFVRYYGFDWPHAMVMRAAAEYGGETVRFKTYEPSPAHRFDMVACVGPFNLSDGWSKERTWHTLRHLWETFKPRALAVSLYAGADENCLQYDEREIRGCGYTLAFDVTVTRILPNDLLMVARR
jgi:hypothetical protein